MKELVCPECKGHQFQEIADHSYECLYCGAIVKEEVKETQQQTIIIQQPVAPAPIVTPFPAEISYVASLKEGIFNTLGGKLYIYPDKFVFTPHHFNSGNLSPREWKISDITGYTKGMMYSLVLKMKDGKSVHLQVYGKKNIIKELEARRQYWLEKK